MAVFFFMPSLSFFFSFFFFFFFFFFFQGHAASCGCCPERAAGRLPGGAGGFLRPVFGGQAASCGCCPERAAGRLPGGGQGARGGAPPLRPLASPVHPAFGEGGGRLLNPAVPRPPRAARGVGADLPAPSGRAMSAPAAALRPPEASGIAFAPASRWNLPGMQGRARITIPTRATSRNLFGVEGEGWRRAFHYLPAVFLGNERLLARKERAGVRRIVMPLTFQARRFTSVCAFGGRGLKESGRVAAVLQLPE